MPVESKPLFHPEVIRQRLTHFALPPSVEESRERLRHWADLIASGRADALNETDLLPDFLTDIFVNLLGYTRPAQSPDCHTLSRETQVVVDGQKVDAVLGRFRPDGQDYVVAVEGKGTRDPLEIPFGGRRMSAVDQCYRYAINLPCDWIVVTSMRETRLYHKGSNQQTYERFETVRLAADDGLLRRFVFLLGADRVVPATGDCHFKELLAKSETVGREVTNRFYAFYADLRLSVFARLREENAAMPAGEILRCSQKLLDRILFCAFCEDRTLLPPETVRGAFEHADPYNPRPIWENFRGLFRSVDKGNPGLKIPAYNGGLFAHDAGLDSLTVPDDVCALFRDLAAHDFRPARLVAETAATGEIRPVIDVDILGHIFEQSITDLERIRQDIESGSLPAAGKDARYGPLGKAESGGKLGSDEPLIPQIPTDFTDKDLETSGFSGSQCVSGSMGESSKEIAPRQQAGATAILLGKDARARRKQEGAFYTPAFITRYIVGQTLGAVLDARFEALRASAEAAAAATARKALADPAAYDPATLNDPQRKALVAFWESWQEVLKRLRILDPACGSGAFLIEAFDQLHAFYESTNQRLEELRGERTLFDPGRSILQHNLYGVDLNPEAVQICQLSLWIKTAAHGKALTSLDHSIREGNSVVADPAVHPKAFDWQDAFPEVFAQGGFDVVIGNPPYVRQELLTPYKPWLEKNYASYHGMADLYVYFYELGLRVLKPGGLLSYIVTNKWMKAGYGEPLRRFFSDQSWIRSVVDFGHAKQIFEDADVFPCIIVAEKPTAAPKPETARLCTIPREQLRIEDLSVQIEQEGENIEIDQLGTQSWQLESPRVTLLYRKLTSKGTPLGEYLASVPKRGTMTGFNDAFLLDTAKFGEIVKDDPRSLEIIHPYFRGQDIGRWHTEQSGQYMIVMKSSNNYAWQWSDEIPDSPEAEAKFRNAYPGIYAHMKPFEAQLRARKNQVKHWWELSSCAFWDEFEKPKIIYQEIQFHPSYSLDVVGNFGNNKTFFLSTDDLYLLAVLNSPLMWWHNWRYLPHMKDEALSPVAFKMTHLPIAEPTPAIREAVETTVRRLIEITASRQETHRVLHDWLRVEFAIEKPSNKLHNLTALDSDAFIAEVKNIRGRKLPLTAAALQALRQEHTTTIEPARHRAAEALALEQQINHLVNQAYALTPEETALLWSTAPPRMPIPAPSESTKAG